MDPSAFAVQCTHTALLFFSRYNMLQILEEEINARDDGTTQSTASYQHCLHRVRTMSDMALARRVSE